MEKERPWVIFGAGRMGKIACSVLDQEVEFFIDNDAGKQNREAEIPVISLEEGKPHLRGKSVLIGTLNPTIEQEMRGALSGCGAARVVSFSELNHISEYDRYDYSDILDAIWLDTNVDEYLYHVRQWKNFTSDKLLKPVDELCEKYKISGGKLVDIACGYGFWSLYFVRRQMEVLGMDNDAAKMPACQRIAKKYPRLTLVNADACNIDFVPDDTQDVVFCGNSIHIIPDWRRVISEMKRVARPNGLILLTMTHPENLYVREQYKDVPYMQWDATRENIAEAMGPEAKLLEAVEIFNEKAREFTDKPTHSALIFSKQPS